MRAVQDVYHVWHGAWAFMQRLCTCISEAGVYEHVVIVYKSCCGGGFSYSALYFF